ncbi:hypothetical protein K432DRAFT_286118, partial [Lepidopterella palustris CBS 459.81]
QLDELRLTIPRIIQPLRTSHSTPAALYQDFRQSALGATNGLKKFRLAWDSEETQNIFEHTKDSQRANMDLSASAGVSMYGWVDTVENEQKANSIGSNSIELEKEDRVAVLDENENVAAIVDAFKKEHPKYRITLEAEDQIINIFFKVPTLLMTFRIIRKKESNGRYKLDAECMGKSNLFPSITRCLASRPRANDLKFLLDMIAAYTDSRRAICAKCNKLLDGSALTPAARRSKQVENSNGSNDTIWEAFHEGCL